MAAVTSHASDLCHKEEILYDVIYWQLTTEKGAINLAGTHFGHFCSTFEILVQDDQYTNLH
jgi:hypothetical protein